MTSHIPENLRCEYEKNPLGVQKSQPLLSWQVREEAAPESGWQQAYQIVASSKESLLSEGIYDPWDSGIVKSRRSYAIPYQGTALKTDLLDGPHSGSVGRILSLQRTSLV